MNSQNEGYEIDIFRLALRLIDHIWIILLSALLCGGLALGYTRFFMTPMYSAKALLYVNNSAFSVESALASITREQARSMISTYQVILKTRSILNEVIEQSGINRTYESLSGMISVASVDGTEIFSVTVVSSDPDEAKLIANTVAEVFSGNIGKIMSIADVSIVDYAIQPTGAISPNYKKNTLIGVLAGLVLSCGVIFLIDFFDDVIHDEDYVAQSFDIPLLAAIPDLSGASASGKSYGYGYGYSSQPNVKKKGE